MKKMPLIAIAAVTIIFSACTKEDTLTHLQPHDQNKMMMLMHQMMMSMDTVPKTNDPEIDFLRMMRVHHQGAIKMANLELQEGKNDSLKHTAQKIIMEQQAEIADFSAYLATHSANNAVPAFMMEHEESMMKMAKTADVQFITGDIDNDFPTLMIPHHQAATENAMTYLKYGDDKQVAVWAEKIIKTQKMEIIELSNWLITNRR
jgi:uncharacterized protein (DUF305 family)